MTKNRSEILATFDVVAPGGTCARYATGIVWSV